MGIINLIILFGMVQGFILSLVLFFSGKQNYQHSKYFLGIFLIILIYNGLETLNWSAAWHSAVFSLYTFTWIFGVGPSIYFYVQSFVKPLKVNRVNILKHYSPVFIQFVLRSALLIHWVGGQDRALTLWLDAWFAAIAEPLSALHTAVYVGIAWKNLHTYKRQAMGPKLLTEELSLLIRWSHRFLIFNTAIVLLWVLTLLTFCFFPEPSSFSFYYPAEIALVLFIYWIGFTGYHQLYVIRGNPPPSTSSALNDLSADEINHCLLTLKRAMEEEKLYRDNELALKKLAEHLAIPPKTISALLNQQLKQGFNQFVNAYRVEEVKRELFNPRKQHLTITAIALEAGFNSQATFSRVFKHQVGLTPKEFLAQEREKAKN